MPKTKHLLERAGFAVQKMRSYAINRVEAGVVKERIDVPILGALVMESLSKHVTAGRVSPTGIKSLHGLLFPFFRNAPINDATRELVKAYRKAISGDTKRVAGIPLADYVAKVVTLPLGDCLKSLLDNGLLPSSFVVNAGNISLVLNRQIHAQVQTLTCVNPEELGEDEIYVVNTGTIYDATGIWNSRVHASSVYEDIGGDDIVDLTKEEKFLMDFSAQNGPDGQNSVSAMCSMTVIEHEYGDIDKIKAALNAAYTAGRMIAAVGAATGPVGGAIAVGVAIPSLLLSLAVFLDGDDELGSFALRFDNFLDGPTWDKKFSLRIGGTHLLNDYRYKASLRAFTEDVLGQPPQLSITGKSTVVSTQLEGPTHAAYRLNCAAELRNIDWSVQWTGTGSGTLALGQGPTLSAGNSQREVTVTFRFVGNYRVSVSAKNVADGRTMSDHIDVKVKFTSQGGSLHDSGMEIQVK